MLSTLAVITVAAVASTVNAVYCPTVVSSSSSSSSSAVPTGYNDICPSTAVSCSNNPLTNLPYDECCVALNGLLVFSQNWTAGLYHNAKAGQTTWVTKDTVTKLPHNSWTVHGLWPDFCNGNYNTSQLGCDPARVYEDVQSRIDNFKDEHPSLVKDMYKFWLGGDGDYNWFWSHEWTKHATCFSPLKPSCLGDDETKKDFDVLKYFQISMDLRVRFPLYDIFADKGIVPSTKKTYYRQNFTDALVSATGSRGGIQCVKDAQGTQYVSEVYIYLLSRPNLEFDIASPDLVNYNDTNGVNHRDFQSCNDTLPIYYWPQTAFDFLD